jgi:hypothetical protein
VTTRHNRHEPLPQSWSQRTWHNSTYRARRELAIHPLQCIDAATATPNNRRQQETTKPSKKLIKENQVEGFDSNLLVSSFNKMACGSFPNYRIEHCSLELSPWNRNFHRPG